MTTLLQQRVLESGNMAPSLWNENVNDPNDGFEDAVTKVLDGSNGLSLRPDMAALTSVDFAVLIKLASDPLVPNQVLVRRRSIILAIVAKTPTSNAALRKILANGFLTSVKLWLSNALHGSVGGADFLLHLLTSITFLPVTKGIIASSKMGKAVVQAEKSKKFVDSPNLHVLKEKVALLKDEWTKSVKTKKAPASSTPSPAKRKVDTEDLLSLAVSSVTKKQKPNERKGLSMSDLLRKSGAASSTKPPSPESDAGLSAAEKARKRAKERQEKERARLAANDLHIVLSVSDVSPVTEGQKASKPKKNVSFADEPFVLNANEEGLLDKIKSKAHGNAWTDMKKKEHLHEKELLGNAKKQQMITHQTKLDAMTTTLAPWRMPGSTANAPFVQVESPEIAFENARIATVTSSRFLRGSDIPRNPTPLSQIEENLEQRVHGSILTAAIPFFIHRPPIAHQAPGEVSAPAPFPAFVPPPVAPPPAAPQYDDYGAGTYGIAASGSTYPVGNGGATPEYVQTAGLPAFLVGSNVKALQTVISSPGLLQTFMNSNGQYDEVRLKNLVQNLTPSAAPTPVPAPFPATATPFSVYVPSTTAYQSASTPNSYFPPPPPQAPVSTNGFSAYGAEPSRPSQVQPLQTQFSKGGYRGDQNTTDGNLHVSGYGQGATQDEIYAIFAQYVQITELVPKGTFCFINTNDPEGARRAKQALHGSIVGGSPIKINFAVRKERDPSKMRGLKPFGADSRSYSQQQSTEMPTTKSSYSEGSQGGFSHINQGGFSKSSQGGFNQGGFDNNVKDDRGNPATKNLFVAGYGPGTTEHQIRELFSQFGQVTGTVLKPSYAFVNLSSRETAIAARQSLMGQSLNGSTLRVNFAKESGRLGTSFDQTYNSSSYGSAAQHSHRSY